MWGGNGFWSPTRNRPAMKAFTQSIRRRAGRRRSTSSGWRFVVELLGVMVVAGGIYAMVALVT